jgi:argininosuccinate lyase
VADYLFAQGNSIREAHELVGGIVMRAIERGVEIDALSLDEMQSFSPLIEHDVFHALSLEQTLAAKSQVGGTSPARVASELDAAKRRL